MAMQLCRLTVCSSIWSSIFAISITYRVGEDCYFTFRCLQHSVKRRAFCCYLAPISNYISQRVSKRTALLSTTEKVSQQYRPAILIKSPRLPWISKIGKESKPSGSSWSSRGIVRHSTPFRSRVFAHYLTVVLLDPHRRNFGVLGGDILLVYIAFHGL